MNRCALIRNSDVNSGLSRKKQHCGEFLNKDKTATKLEIRLLLGFFAKWKPDFYRITVINGNFSSLSKPFRNAIVNF